MRPQIVAILTFLLFLANGMSMLGQSTSAGSGPPPPPQMTPQLPLDSEYYILLIAGILLGINFVIHRVVRKHTPQ